MFSVIQQVQIQEVDGVLVLGIHYAVGNHAMHRFVFHGRIAFGGIALLPPHHPCERSRSSDMRIFE